MAGCFGPDPLPVKRTLLVSVDRDLLVERDSGAKQKYGAAAGDWKSGAIAWVAQRNNTRLLILRGVSDLVCSAGNVTYGNLGLFEEAAYEIIRRLVESLPGWICRDSGPYDNDIIFHRMHDYSSRQPVVFTILYTRSGIDAARQFLTTFSPVF